MLLHGCTSDGLRIGKGSPPRELDAPRACGTLHSAGADGAIGDDAVGQVLLRLDERDMCSDGVIDRRGVFTARIGSSRLVKFLRDLHRQIGQQPRPYCQQQQGKTKSNMTTGTMDCTKSIKGLVMPAKGIYRNYTCRIIHAINDTIFTIYAP